jgi:hypothetical protein
MRDRETPPWQAAPMPDELDVRCPRCGHAVTQRFYGPCDDCRRELRSTVAGEVQVLEAESFEPKMNVTPNAVALKE